MGFLTNNQKARDLKYQSRINTLDKDYREAKYSLVNEQIRGVLISIKNSLGYLSRLKNRNIENEEFHYVYAAKDCYSQINLLNISTIGLCPELIDGLEIVKGKLTNKLVDVCHDYAYEPIDALVYMARSEKLLEVIDYVNELIRSIEQDT